MLGSRRAYSVFQEEDIEQKVALNQLSLGADQAEANGRADEHLC